MTAAVPAPMLECDHAPDAEGRRVSNDGTIDLDWSAPPGPAGWSYELEQASEPSFAAGHLRYAGPDRESVLTGLSEGDYHFRVRALDADGSPGPWSAPLALHVEFMGRRSLLVLLGTGALVVTLTVGAIARGFLHHR